MLLAVLVAPGAHASVLVNTLDTGNGFRESVSTRVAWLFVEQGVWGTGITRSAVGFTVTGGTYRLESISLPISDGGYPPGDHLRVSLAEDLENVPANTIETLSDRQPWPAFDPSSATLTKLYSSDHSQLVLGSKYWIVVEFASLPQTSSIQKAYDWYHNTTGAVLPVWHMIEQSDSPTLPYEPWGWDNWHTYLTFEEIAVRVEGTATVGVPPSAPATRLAPARPTPFRGRTILEYEIAQGGRVEVVVFSVTGARVRTLWSGEHAPGPGRLTWDGLEESGQRAPAGLYLVRLEAGATKLQQRIIKLD